MRSQFFTCEISIGYAFAKTACERKNLCEGFCNVFFGEWNMRLANVAQLTDKYREIVCCGNLLRSGAGQLYRRWRKVLRRRSAGAVFKPPQAARVKSSRGERCWKRRGSPRQVCLMKTNVSEPLMTCRNVNSDVETRIWISILRARVGKGLLIAQPASGMKAA